MPYRVDLGNAGGDALDRLIDLGAIDAESSDSGGIAALMPDRVTPEQVAVALGIDAVAVTRAIARDDGSVWILSPRTIRIGRLRIVPDGAKAEPGDLKLIDAAAFGTGLHPTTALCLEILEEAVQADPPDSVLDVGTGSGVLALAALRMGVPQALGIDIDDEALRVATENADINGMSGRFQIARGGPETVSGTWPLVFANVVAAPLIEMAPILVRRVSHHGRLVLSGIPASVEHNVDDAYRRLGMQRLQALSRAGWVALVMQATW